VTYLVIDISDLELESTFLEHCSSAASTLSTWNDKLIDDASSCGIIGTLSNGREAVKQLAFEPKIPPRP
jgi:hypothetical protein